MEHKARIKILQMIFESFQQMTQWVTTNPNSYAEYHNQAKALIELLEIEDCGSIGGFDKDSPLPKICKYELYDRFLALINKHDDFDNIKPCCEFTPRDLIRYFNILDMTRETFNEKLEI